MQRDHFTDEHDMFREAFRTFLDREMVPHREAWTEAEIVDRDVFAKAGASGFLAMAVPEQYGGAGVDDFRYSQVIVEELTRADLYPHGLGMTLHNDVCLPYFLDYTTDEQKQRWLPGMAKLELIGAFALTEPQHGSDSVALETTARRDGDHWVLNGTKRWIGNGSIGHVVIVWARDEADGKVKGFVIEREGEGLDSSYPEGYRAELITGKIGKRAIWQPDIVLDNVRVPEANRLTNANGFRDVSRVLTATRGGASWEAAGHAVAAYEAALTYATNRQQFGKPIASYQLVQNKLANMLAETTNIQLMCFRMAQLQEQGKLTGPMASLAKMYTAKTARSICAEARDILGGNGLLLDFHVARHMTDMEVVHTYEGTDSIQSLIIGRDITGISAFD